MKFDEGVKQRMSEFFDFSLWCAQAFVSWLVSLPFLSGISFGHMLAAAALLMVVTAALVGSIKAVSLSPEAHAASRRKGP